jgi:ssDNA-binding Zn-finger/Zn-ribbon topoisomerase 1
MNELMDYISGEVANIKQNGVGIKIDTNPCPACGKPLRRIKKKEKNSFFWGCTGFSRAANTPVTIRPADRHLVKHRRSRKSTNALPAATALCDV